MKLAGCFHDTKTNYMSKDQGNFDFSCHHDPFNCKILSNLWVLEVKTRKCHMYHELYIFMVKNSKRTFPEIPA